jgi:hypothetical protein
MELLRDQDHGVSLISGDELRLDISSTLSNFGFCVAYLRYQVLTDRQQSAMAVIIGA